MKQWGEGGFLTQSHLSCLPLSRMSIWCKMRVKGVVPGALPVNLMLLEKKSGGGGARRKKGERNREEEGYRFAKGEEFLITLDFLAGFGNAMTLTYRENECFSFFLP